MHKHYCPGCYEAWSCDDSCTIEDEYDGRTKYGSHMNCSDCSPSAVNTEQEFKEEINKETELEYTKEFWDRYHGIKPDQVIQDQTGKKVEMFSPEWWGIYHGYIRVK